MRRTRTRTRTRRKKKKSPVRLILVVVAPSLHVPAQRRFHFYVAVPILPDGDDEGIGSDGDDEGLMMVTKRRTMMRKKTKTKTSSYFS